MENKLKVKSPLQQARTHSPSNLQVTIKFILKNNLENQQDVCDNLNTPPITVFFVPLPNRWQHWILKYVSSIQEQKDTSNHNLLWEGIKKPQSFYS